MKPPFSGKQVAVLISGRGSNLQSLIDAADRLNASHVAQVFAVVDAANKMGL